MFRTITLLAWVSLVAAEQTVQMQQLHEQQQIDQAREASVMSECLTIESDAIKTFHFDVFTEDGMQTAAIELVRDPVAPKLIVHKGHVWEFTASLKKNEMMELDVTEADLIFTKKPRGTGDQTTIELPLYEVEYIKQVRLHGYQSKKAGDFRAPDGIEIGYSAPKGTQGCWAPSCLVIQRFVGGSFYDPRDVVADIRAQIAETMMKTGNMTRLAETILRTPTEEFKLKTQHGVGAAIGAGAAMGAVLVGVVAIPAAPIVGAFGAFMSVPIGIGALAGFYFGDFFGKHRLPNSASENIFDKLRCLSNEFMTSSDRYFKCRDKSRNDVLVPWKLAEAVEWDCTGF